MKLITYKSDDNEGIGSLEQDKIIPFGDDPSLPTDMLSFLEAGESAANKAVVLCKNSKSKISLSDVLACKFFMVNIFFVLFLSNRRCFLVSFQGALLLQQKTREEVD